MGLGDQLVSRDLLESEDPPEYWVPLERQEPLVHRGTGDRLGHLVFTVPQGPPDQQDQQAQKDHLETLDHR